MQKVNSDEGLNSNTMCWKLSWEKMSIASTLQFEMKWLYWLKDTRKQDPYVIYVFFSLLFLSTFWADMIDHKGIRGAAVSVFRANMFFLWFFAIPYPTVQRLSPLKICFRSYGLWCRRIRHHVMMSKWWVRIKVNMKRKMPTRARKKRALKSSRPEHTTR